MKDFFSNLITLLVELLSSLKLLGSRIRLKMHRIFKRRDDQFDRK